MPGAVSAFRHSLNYYSACIATFIVAVAASPVAVLLLSTGLPAVVALPVTVMAAAAALIWVVPRVPNEWAAVLRDKPRWVVALWTVCAAVIAVVVARLAVFQYDPNQLGYSMMPDNEFMAKHNHVTGYVSGALIGEHDVGNLYDTDRYASSAADGVLPGVDPLDRDVYVYPPPFLVLPWLLLKITSDFFTVRAIWFAVYTLVILGGLLGVARWVGGRQGAVLALLTPVVFASLPTLATLQLGNIHVAAVYVGTVAAMVLFYRRRFEWAGGALLAFAITCKVSPALMLVYLLVQRRWKALGYTAAFGAGYALATLAVFGTGPYKSFLGDGVWQRLATGEFHAGFVLQDAAAVINNYSPFGIPYKIDLLTDIGDPFPAARLVSNVYTLALVVLVAVLAHRLNRIVAERADDPRLRAELLVTWLAILTLASFRAPFGPWTYIAVGAVWLFAAFATLMPFSARNVAILATCWFIVAVYGPPEAVGPMVTFTFIAQTIIYVAGFGLPLRLTRRRESLPEPAPV